MIEFRPAGPVDRDGLRANVVSCLARNLPAITVEPLRPEVLTVLANGPSALMRPECTGPILAVNGALALTVPTYWMACDPQDLVADFLSDPPAETQYLIASRCSPAVFDRLRDRDVRVFHMWEDATIDLLKDRKLFDSIVSVTLTSFWVMYALGFQKFQTWGWDCSFAGEASHAVPQPHSVARSRVTFPNGQIFDSTGVWVLEAQEAARRFSTAPFSVETCGPGMLPAVIRLMNG